MRLFPAIRAVTIRCCATAALLLSAASSVLALADSCAIVTSTRDGFLSLRAGPGTHYREVMKLPGGQFIGIDDLRGDSKREWIHVNGLMDRTSEGDLVVVRAVEGWAFGRYVHHLNCMVDRPPIKQAQPKPVPPQPLARYESPPPRYEPLPRAAEGPPPMAPPAAQLALTFRHGVARRQPGEGVAPFRITTSAGADYFFKLVRQSTNQEEIAGFIIGGIPLETKVPSGSYELRYAAGDIWISEEEFFGLNTAFAKAESPLIFSIDGDRVRGVEVQLILQRGGNLKTSTIKRSEF